VVPLVFIVDPREDFVNPPSGRLSDRHSLEGFALNLLIHELTLRFCCIERQNEPLNVRYCVSVSTPAVERNGHAVAVKSD